MNKILCSKPGHQLVEIQPGLWRLLFHYPSTTNCWFWDDSDGLTLVDAGHPWDAAAIMSAVQQIGQPLRRIVITHAHPDHSGAAAEVTRATGAQVFAHESEIDYLEGRGWMSDLPGFWMCHCLLVAGRCLGILNAPPIEKVVPLSDGSMVGDLRVLHTPGHTPGSISLWAERSQAIFCGDNVMYSRSRLYRGLPWFTLDLDVQKKSCRRYTELPASLLLSGHGPEFRGDVASAMQRLL
jgi:glyoxylase-like metal-dependent hydrolase (beta-lactamase superfamily II)